MALKLIGDAGYEVDVGPDKALFVENRPPASADLGSFSTGWNSADCDVNQGTDANIGTIRWTDANSLCLVRRITAQVLVWGAVSTGVQFTIAAYFARSFTADPSSNLTQRWRLGRANNKLVSTSAASGVAFLGTTSFNGMGGTFTKDTNPLTWITSWSGTTAGLRLFPPNTALLDRTGYGQHPVVLAQNEGIVISNPKVAPGNGVWRFYFNVEWQEVPSY